MSRILSENRFLTLKNNEDRNKGFDYDYLQIKAIGKES